MITRIAQASRERPPHIVSRTSVEWSDGQWRSLGMEPRGGATKTGNTQTYYVAMSPDGSSTIGNRFPTEEAAKAHYEQSAEKKVADFRIQLAGMSDKELQNQAAYWLKEKPTPESPKAAVSKPTPPKPVTQRQPLRRPGRPTTGNAEDDAKLAQARALQKAGKPLTRGDELTLFLHGGEEKADPSKWKQGDGVGYYAGPSNGKVRGSQVNRGFRVLEVDPETKLARVRQVADTGLTSSGGDTDRVGDQWVHVADLLRDKRYDAPPRAATTETVPSETPTAPPQYESSREEAAVTTQQENARAAKIADLTEQEAALRQQIAKRGGVKGKQAGATLHPDDFVDLAHIGAIKIARGALKFADWSDQMVSEFGDWIREHLSQLWQKSQELHQSEYAPPPAQEAEPVKATVEALSKPIAAPAAEAGGGGVRVPPEKPPAPPAAPEPRSDITQGGAVSGSRNAVTEAEREGRRAEQIAKYKRPTPGASFEAGKTMPAHEAESLADAVAAKPRQLEAHETGALAAARVRWNQTASAAIDRIIQAKASGDTEGLKAAQEQLAMADARRDVIDHALTFAGTEQSGAFYARTMLARNEDNSFVAQAKEFEARRGRPPTGDVSDPTSEIGQLKAAVDAHVKAIADLTEHVGKQNEKLSAQEDRIANLEAQKTAVTLRREAAKEGRTSARESRKLGLEFELADLAQRVRERKGSGNGTLKMGWDPTGGKYDDASVAEMASWAYRYAKAKVALNIGIPLERLVTETWETMKQHFEDLTPRNVRDLISGYGKVSLPNPEATAKQLRELTGQSRLVSALDDAEAKLRPLKSGPQRDAQSEVVRGLRKQVNEAMRRNGIEATVTDPAQKMKTALDAVKTRLKNEIQDYNRYIATGERKPGSTPIRYDADATRLKAERDALKAQYDALNKGDLDRAKIAMAIQSTRRAMIETARRITERDVASRAATSAPWSPELGQLKSQHAELRAQLQSLRDAATPTAMEITNRRAARIAALQKQVAALDARIKTGDVRARPSTSAPWSAEEGRLQQRKAQLNAQIAEMRQAAGPTEMQQTNARARYRESLTSQMSELNRQIASGTKPAPRTPRVLDEQTATLKAVVEATRLRRDQMVKGNEPRTLLQKVNDYARAAKLSGFTVIEKLLGASAWHHPTELASEPFGYLAGKIRVGGRFLGQVAEREGFAPGQGMPAAIRAVMRGKGVRDAVQQIKTGADEIGLLAGKGVYRRGELSSIPGRTHGAEKVAFIGRPEFERAVEIRSTRAVMQGKDLTKATTQFEIMGKAAMDAQNQMLMGENHFTKALKQSVGAWERSPSQGVQVLGAFLRSLVPIARVSSNLLGKGIRMTGIGVFEGAGKTIYHIAKGGRELTPEVADDIIRAFKYGGLGAVAAYVGMNQPQGFKVAGFYAPNGVTAVKGSDGQPMKPGEVEVLGHKLPAVLAHSPFLLAAQTWATFGNGLRYGERGKEGDTESALYQTARGVAEEVPGVESIAQLAKVTEGKKQAEQAAGEYTRGMLIPQGVQQVAKATDTEATRKPQTFGQELEVGVPYLRGNVPAQGPRRGRPHAAPGLAGTTVNPSREIRQATRIR